MWKPVTSVPHLRITVQIELYSCSSSLKKLRKKILLKAIPFTCLQFTLTKGSAYFLKFINKLYTSEFQLFDYFY